MSRLESIKELYSKGTAEVLFPDLGTDIVGNKIIYYPVINSTNLKARELITEGEKEGTIVLADSQTTGKGRRGRNWYSPPGSGLWFSVIFRPDFAPPQSPVLTIATSLAVARVLEKRGYNPVIKWPNDILLQGKKVSGILSELVTSGEQIRAVIVGIGINVKQKKFPPHLIDRATSLIVEGEYNLKREKLLIEICCELEEVYLQLVDDKKKVVQAWKGCLNIIDRFVEIDSGSERIQGKVVDLTYRGELVMIMETGEKKIVRSGEASILDIEGTDIKKEKR
ncbi:MAG: biotin--[acetyl-CoA-carboxylase] ligase [Halanaerobiales bacterium]